MEEYIYRGKSTEERMECRLIPQLSNKTNKQDTWESGPRPVLGHKLAAIEPRTLELAWNSESSLDMNIEFRAQCATVLNKRHWQKNKRRMTTKSYFRWFSLLLLKLHKKIPSSRDHKSNTILKNHFKLILLSHYKERRIEMTGLKIWSLFWNKFPRFFHYIILVMRFFCVIEFRELVFSLTQNKAVHFYFWVCTTMYCMYTLNSLHNPKKVGWWDVPKLCVPVRFF